MADARFDPSEIWRAPGEQVRVCIAQEQFRTALREIKTKQDDVIVTGLDGPVGSYPGFAGTMSTLASFMLVARERFGPYDSEMLARIVDFVASPHDPTLFRFYFRGLQLY